MSTTVAAPVSARRPGRLFFRVLLSIVLLALLALGGTSIWFYHAAHASLPQLDGSVAVSGLKAPVEVVRDAQGVPHISAASLDDLFFAQGYTVAQDRLWQIDMARRFVGGETAEILPASAGPWLKHDRQQRLLRLRSVAENVARRLPARDLAFFEAYARGVNAFIDQHRDNLPVEFRVLGYSPRPWRPADSIVIGLGMSQLLNPQYEMEYWRGKMGEHLAPELMADLYPASGGQHEHPPASEAAATAVKKTAVPESTAALTSGGNRLPDGNPVASAGDPPAGPMSLECEACVPGSNNWAVAGALTTTGKPLLSNDMHLGHQLPSTWYEMHLHAGDYNVTGFSLPGMPFIIVGHNQRIAWGYTNLNPDVQDLFIENFNASGEYETPSGWQKPEIDHQVIHVKGKPDVAMDIVVTRHGPVISELFQGEERKLALQWLVYDDRAIGIPLFDLNSAQNWEQFRKALSAFATPSQNVVYADVDGHIGYQPMGFIPVRASGDGTVPAPGADGKHDWTGYIPFDKLPSLYDPPSGIVATANARITPDGYPYLLSTQWFPPYRTERIYKVLESGRKFSPDDMLALQTDITSDYDRFFAQKFVEAIDHSSKPNGSKSNDRVKKAAEIMRGFDGRMLADSAAATIEVNARRTLWKKLLLPRLGPLWMNYTWSESSVALENIVRTQPARWLPSEFTNFNDLLTAAVEDALAGAPSDLSTWKYGEQYPVEINHPLFGTIPFLRGLTGPGVHPQSGGGFTVKQVGRRFGPSERMTVDFSSLDNSHFNIVIGESGQPFSPYFMDQWDAWYNNKTFTMPFSEKAVKAAESHLLRLEPK
ncbi:MAG: penicillin acylase family protein [Acidobacteriia bacterium]|nr:penicillin acylase family protein [Terriglobia bacterium]